MKELEQANELMENGEKEKVHEVLQSLLVKFPEKNSVYQDAVNIYLLGNMYQEAKNVFRLYKANTGKELLTDFTYQEIEKEEKDNAAAARGLSRSPKKIFKRMTLLERGDFSNYPTLFPIKEIIITDQEIVLRKSGNDYTYKWEDVSSALILKRKRVKPYIAEFLQRLFELRVPGKIFRFDVSSNYPDFKHSSLLIEELKKHLHIEEKEDKRIFRLW